MNLQKKVNDSMENVAELFQLPTETAYKIRHGKVARTIGALPFVAGCEAPEQTAMKNLALYMTAHKNQVFDCRPAETLAARLNPIANFKGGNQDVIRKGMKMLELASLEDHYTDQALDLKEGKENPINAGEIDYHAQRARLLGEINSIVCPELDQILMGSSDEPAWIPEGAVSSGDAPEWWPEAAVQCRNEPLWMPE